MDGTIYRGKRLFDCTLPFLRGLDEHQIGYSFLTNNTSKSQADYVAKLASLGISTSTNAIFTAADHFIDWAKTNKPETTRLCIVGTPSLVSHLGEAGYSDDWDSPEAVLVGYDPALCLERLGRAAYWIDKGLPFYATHPDRVCPTDQPTVLIDCGSICACITAATGRLPLVFGKPSPDILHALCRKLSIKRTQALMIGDRLYTDIAMARDAGVASILVLTGEATLSDIAASDIAPDFIAEDIGVVGECLAEANI